MAEKDLEITVLRPPAPQAGDYIETLDEWGALPEVMPLPDVARFIAHKCSQNPAAILKVLEQAVLNFDIPFSGLTSAGEWKPGFIRFIHRFSSAPQFESRGDGQEQVALQLENGGRLHSVVMGVSISDAVALLAKRGRKVPEELRHLLPEEEAADAPSQVSDVKDGTSAVEPWVEKAHEYAPDIWRVEFDNHGRAMTKKELAMAIATRLRAGRYRTKRNKEISAGYVERFVLRGWMPPEVDE